MGLESTEFAPNKEPIKAFLESFGITIEEIQDMQIGQKSQKVYINTFNWHAHKAVITRTENGFEIKYFDDETPINGSNLSEKSTWSLLQDGKISMESGSFDNTLNGFMRSKNGALANIKNGCDSSENNWFSPDMQGELVVQRRKSFRKNQ